MAADAPAGRPGFRPTHPGLILRHDIEALGLTQEALSDHIGVSRQTVSAIVAGRSRLTVDIACRVSKAIGGTAQFWVTLQTAHDVWEAERAPAIKTIKKVRPAQRARGLSKSA